MTADSPTPPKHEYGSSVFINCPFDEQYKPLFRALVFTVEYCGFTTRSALEVDDSGETRAEKLIRLIRGSRFGIHDISRTESSPEGLPRFNMPYEFGLFVGFKYGGTGVQRKKVTLVLDREPYRYQRFLSDIAGQDIKSHGGQVNKLIRVVRDWLQNQSDQPLMGAHFITEQFGLFTAEVPHLLAALKMTDAELNNYTDFRRLVYDWIKVNKSS